MSAGMAEVIAAHVPTTASNTFNAPESGSGRYCRCGHFVRVVHSAMDDSRSTDSYLDELLASHVTEELAKAGFGDVREAKREAWNRGYLYSYHQERGYDDQEAQAKGSPSHLVSELRKWNPFNREAPHGVD